MSAKVSIIIPCKEINSYVEECVRRCLSLDYPDFEIIVLPDTDSRSALAGVKVMTTGKVGPSQKRDLALKANGDVLAFIDDDAYPDKGWLKEAVKHFQDDNIAAVGGPAVTPPQDSPEQKASGYVFASWLGSGGLRYRYIPQEKREVDDFPSCNLLIRKPLFQQLGGFNTNFWPGEDTKLCLEITEKLGKKIIYDPEVLVYHHRRRLFRPHLKQVWSYAVHRGYFMKILPGNSFRPTYFIPSLFCLGLLLGIILSFFNPVIKIVFLSALVFYLLAVLLSSLVAREKELVPLVFLGIIMTHLTYGIGFIKGLLTRRLTR